MALMRNLTEPDPDVFDAIRRLARDDHWAVRFQVRAHVNALWDANRDLMWELIDEAGREEPNIQVLRFFVNTITSSLRGVDPARIDAIVTAIQDRVNDVDGHDTVARDLVSLVIWRVVVQEHRPSKDRIANWIRDPTKNLPYVEALIQQCRGLMVLNVVGKDEARAQRARHWAFAALHTVVEPRARHPRCPAAGKRAEWRIPMV